MSRISGNGPRPSPADRNATVVYNLTLEIDRTIQAYHKHSKECRPCRNPREAYEQRRDTCPTGRELQRDLMNVLYLKAEYVPEGTFLVEYSQGWYEIDELIRVICHYKQGEYTRRIIDLKRAKPRSSQKLIEAPASPTVPYRGSTFDDDLLRKQRAAEPTPLHFSSTNLAAFHNPSPAGSHVSSGDRKSVKFDTRIQVREYRDP